MYIYNGVLGTFPNEQLILNHTSKKKYEGRGTPYSPGKTASMYQVTSP